MPNGWRTIKSLVHKIRLHGRRGKGMAESFSREKLRDAPQKEGGWEILCDLPPVWPRLVRPTNLMSRMNGKKTHKHIQQYIQYTMVCSHVASNSVLFAESGDTTSLFANKEGSSSERRMEGGIADETSMPPLKCECFGSAA